MGKGKGKNKKSPFFHNSLPKQNIGKSSKK